MAYGAILRLCAARGLPERALSLLEDMERFEVKPTTLCFTAALKAVAKSHEIAIRYQRGSSRRDMKRETITAHHGKMARQIVILAEAAEVEQDDGFTSALMLCAAAAGDSATAKAVLLATEVRKMDHLRTVGGSRPDALDDRHSDLLLESGEKNDKNDRKDDKNLIKGRSNVQLRAREQHPTFGEREYGKDTRVISAFVRSCAQAVNKNGLGTMWAGRENLGYLCENSLRLITTRWEPSYRDTRVPGMNSTKVGIGALRHLDERENDYEYTPGKRKKFRGLFVDEDDLATIDDFDRGDDFESDDEDGDDLFSDDKQNTESNDFEMFMSELKEETERSGDNISEDEIREQFALIQEELSELDNVSSDGDIVALRDNNDNNQALSNGKVQNTTDIDDDGSLEEGIESLSNEFDTASNAVLAGLDPIELSRIQDLQSVLPGMPIRRLMKILGAYDRTLGHPSMLTIVPILRETMPDYLSSGWLKKSNNHNAEFTLQKAAEDGVIDLPLINSMLEVKANSGSLNKATEYYEEEFAKWNLVSAKCVDTAIEMCSECPFP